MEGVDRRRRAAARGARRARRSASAGCSPRRGAPRGRRRASGSDIRVDEDEALAVALGPSSPASSPARGSAASSAATASERGRPAPRRAASAQRPTRPAGPREAQRRTEGAEREQRAGRACLTHDRRRHQRRAEVRPHAEKRQEERPRPTSAADERGRGKARAERPGRSRCRPPWPDEVVGPHSIILSRSAASRFSARCSATRTALSVMSSSAEVSAIARALEADGADDARRARVEGGRSPARRRCARVGSASGCGGQHLGEVLDRHLRRGGRGRGRRRRPCSARWRRATAAPGRSSRQVWRFWWMASSVSCTMSSITSAPSPAAARPGDPAHHRRDRPQELGVGALVAAVRRPAAGRRAASRRAASGVGPIRSPFVRAAAICYPAVGPGRPRSDLPAP